MSFPSVDVLTNTDKFYICDTTTCKLDYWAAMLELNWYQIWCETRMCHCPYLIHLLHFYFHREGGPPARYCYHLPIGRKVLQSRMSKTKTSSCTSTEFPYADNMSITSPPENTLQQNLVAVHWGHTKFGLTINCKKTQVIYQSSPTERMRTKPEIKIVYTILEIDYFVDYFPYLESHFSSNGRLKKQVFEDQKHQTIMPACKSVFIPTLLSASETWTAYCGHIKTLVKFHQWSLHSILKFSWEDWRTNVSVLEKGKIWMEFESGENCHVQVLAQHAVPRIVSSNYNYCMCERNKFK